MSVYWVCGYRNLWTRKARTLLTVVGIVLGVATIFAISITAASTAKSLEDFFAQSSGQADLSITSAAESSAGFRQRLLRQVQQFPGVETVVANTSDQSLLLGRDGDVGLQVMGIDPETDRRVRSYEVEQGRFLSAEDRRYTVMLVSPLAEKYDIEVGDEVEMVVAEGTELFQVVGLLKDKGAGRLNLGRVAFMPLDVAQTVFDRGPKVDQMDLMAQAAVADDEAALKRLKEGLQAELGAGYVVDYPGAIGQSVADAMSGFNAAISMFSVIALLVGAMLIYNTFAMTVVERTREIGLLRALGTSKGQLLRLVLSEALFLGLGGTALGLASGPALAFVLIKIMFQMLGGVLPMESFVIPPEGAVQGLVVGLMITFVAALLPAWRGSRISPIEALLEARTRREGFLLRRGWIIGLVLWAVVVVDNFLSFLSGELFFITLFLGATLLVPQTIMLLERTIRLGVTAIYGQPGRLGSMNLQRSKGRVSLTVGVLMVGVTMLIAIGGMNASFTSEVHQWTEAALAGDLYISSFRPLRLQLMRNLREVEGMGPMTPMRYMYVRTVGGISAGGFHGTREIMLVKFIDPQTYGGVALLRFTQDEGDAEAMLERFALGDAVLVSGTVSELLKVGRGDTVRLRTNRGERDFEVAGVVQDFFQGGRAMYASWNDMKRYFGEDKATLFMARVEPGVEVSQVKQQLEEGLARSRHLEVESGEEARAEMERATSQVFAMFGAVVWIAIIVAGLGVTNTVTMSVLERVREIGMLRSLGMFVGQVGRMVLAESLAMGVIGGLFGLLVGLPLSWMMVTGMSQGTGWNMDYIFPAESFLGGAIIAVVVSQVAALYPVWRVAR
ncbi:MAG: ABC transporter permease, partial [Anaerolineae bacterium]|nr:ABC transporter permease [Anaerolineae bacterium]